MVILKLGFAQLIWHFENKNKKYMDKKRIFTHISVDIDAVASIWFFLKFILRKTPADVEIIFKPANWDGGEMGRDDIALDISAGGKGIKGEFKYNRTRSCLLSLAEKYQEKIDQEIKKEVISLVNFIDKHDAEGQKYFKHFRAPENEKAYFADFRGLFRVFMGHQSNPVNNDYQVFLKFYENLENHFNLILKANEVRERLEKVDSSTKIAFLENNHIPSGVLFNQGKKIIIYLDGNDLGVVIGDPRLRNDELVGIITDIVEAAGERFGIGEKNWFLDPGKRLICRGSKKSPAPSPSKVDPRILHDKLLAYLEEVEGRVYQA